MKKHNFIKTWTFVKVFGLFSCLALAGCKTVPNQSVTTVDPLSLLDNNSTFYIAVPKSADPELINKIIKSNMPGASDSDINQICSRVNKVYAGITKSRKSTEIQAAIDSNIPVKYIPKLLTKKNGWESKAYKSSVLDSKSSFSIYSTGTEGDKSYLELSFPSDNIALLGRNIPTMLDTYEEIHNVPAEESIGKTYTNVDEDLYNWLKGAEDEIRFYANSPASYLSMLTGASLDLKLIDVSGSFKPDPKYSNQYLLTLDFNFKNNTFMKLGRNVLALAFGLTGSDYESKNPNALTITNIQISKTQLYKLLIQ